MRAGKFDPGSLDDCRTEGLTPPKSHWAKAIDTPPYYGYPLRPGITFTYLGVTVDEQARVIMQDDQPAKNIFAAGEVMAGNILGKGYLAGFGLTIGSVFGRIAGQGGGAPWPGLDLVKDGARQMTICNACRYCEGYCAVFPAMEQRRIFTKADLTYLANLCFDCRDCYYACQYAPPHEFAVNIPKFMSELRADTYREFTWPAMLSGLFKHNALAVGLITAVSIGYHPRLRAGIPRVGDIVRRSSWRRGVLSSRSIHRHDRAAVVDCALRFGGFHDRRGAILARDPRQRSRANRFYRALARD